MMFKNGRFCQPFFCLFLNFLKILWNIDRVKKIERFPLVSKTTDFPLIKNDRFWSNREKEAYQPDKMGES